MTAVHTDRVFEEPLLITKAQHVHVTKKPSARTRARTYSHFRDLPALLRVDWAVLFGGLQSVSQLIKAQVFIFPQSSERVTSTCKNCQGEKRIKLFFDLRNIPKNV